MISHIVVNEIDIVHFMFVHNSPRGEIDTFFSVLYVTPQVEKCIGHFKFELTLKNNCCVTNGKSDSIWSDQQVLKLKSRTSKNILKKNSPRCQIILQKLC